jgi:hypothetical protein
MTNMMNPDLTQDDSYCIQKLLNGTAAEREMAFSHPKFSILDWETINGKWRQRPRWVEQRNLKFMLKKIQKKLGD